MVALPAAREGGRRGTNVLDYSRGPSVASLGPGLDHPTRRARRGPALDPDPPPVLDRPRVPVATPVGPSAPLPPRPPRGVVRGKAREAEAPEGPARSPAEASGPVPDDKAPATLAPRPPTRRQPSASSPARAPVGAR